MNTGIKRTPMTISGATALQDELQFLKTTKRASIVTAIVEARAHGDLKENAEYHAAREQQSFNEGRIQEIESKLAHAEVIDITKIENLGRVIFGVTVKLMIHDTQVVVMYQIVGEDEANVTQGKLSISSPIARALIGKEVGNVVEVVSPAGIQELEILEVNHL